MTELSACHLSTLQISAPMWSEVPLQHGVALIIIAQFNSTGNFILGDGNENKLSICFIYVTIIFKNKTR